MIRLLCIAFAACAPAACTTSSGGTISIEPGRYEQTFNAVIEVARDEGIPASLRDLRGGVIETVAADAPSLIEPWRWDGSSLVVRTEHTISHQRRRARFEFAPVRFDPEETVESALEGPDLLAMRHPPTDLSDYEGEMELRVWVYLERVHENGIRRDRWTRGKTTRSAIISYDDEGERIVEPSSFWTAERRDAAFEGRLLERIRQLLAEQTASSEGS